MSNVLPMLFHTFTQTDNLLLDKLQTYQPRTRRYM